MTKNKLQDEVCLLLQHCTSHHQHSSSRRKIKKRGRGNRSCLTSPERRGRTSTKNIGIFLPKISRKKWQPTTPNHHHRPRAGHTEYYPTYVQHHDALPRHEGKASEQTWPKFPERSGWRKPGRNSKGFTETTEDGIYSSQPTISW